ncbi:hypothetical protein D3C78_1615040 [compost metagenome]
MADGVFQQRRAHAAAACAGIHHHVFEQRHPRAQRRGHRVQQVDHGDDLLALDREQNRADRGIIDDRRQAALLGGAVRGELGFLGEQLVEQLAQRRDVGGQGGANVHGVGVQAGEG